MKNIFYLLLIVVAFVSCRTQTAQSTNEENHPMLVTGAYILQGHTTLGISGETVRNNITFQPNNIVEYFHHDMIEVLIYELDTTTRRVNIYQRNGDNRGDLRFQLDYINETTLHQNTQNRIRVWKK